MVIFDSVKKEKVEFVPLEAGRVKIYVCGPTVYDDAHLGHARSAIAFDLLRRTLKEQGYAVEFMKNFTDIDDKIINKSKTSGKSIDEITEAYTASYLHDMELLGVERADMEPQATKNLKAMEDMIEKLLNSGAAYKATNGDIYFDTANDKNYGALSHRHDDEESQSRIEHDECKKNRADFALWKAFPEVKDVGFDSRFGRGRPGWHIECSAMIDEGLAYKDKEYCIDIHAGGADLLFPHHENECAQTRCANNKELAKYWMHNGFVNIHGEKMSKSLGNSFFVKDALKVYHGEILRFYLLGTHYRAPLNFNEEDLAVSKKRLDKMYRLKKRVGTIAGEIDSDFKKSLINAMSDDLNISVALSVIDEMVSRANDALDSNPKDKKAKESASANIKYIAEFLGVCRLNPTEYFQLGVSSEQKSEIEKLITQRSEAKKAKDFAKADEIRNTLSSMDIAIMDTPDGTVWEKA